MGLEEDYSNLTTIISIVNNQLQKRNNSIIALECQITELSEITNHPLCRRKHIVIFPLK
jgi:hypothetical protein